MKMNLILVNKFKMIKVFLFGFRYKNILIEGYS